MQKQGFCPYCGNDNLNYGVLEIGNFNDVYYPCNCLNCGKEFKEYYNLEFSEQV